jgi:uncharacterized membrane protein (DUF373 family)
MAPKNPHDIYARENEPGRVRLLIASGFTWVEDVVYVGLGVLLACSALSLLVTGAAAMWRSIARGAPFEGTVEVLDQTLIALMIVELLYTLQVSFREHTLVPEPFLVVGLIAVTRRTLVLTAELPAVLAKRTESQFRSAMIELAILTAMMIALVASLWILRKRELDIASRKRDAAT